VGCPSRDWLVGFRYNFNKLSDKVLHFSMPWTGVLLITKVADVRVGVWGMDLASTIYCKVFVAR